ncbi:MAG: polyphosphate kinase 2, partial [Pseudomonas sp.]|nr:polyphosphate kinase 2 [Pseudomonas sp.]
SEDKKRVRLNVISHLLEHVPYEELPKEKAIKLPKRTIGKSTSNYPFRVIAEKF